MAQRAFPAAKICGITRPEHGVAAANAGARYIGLVFFEKSPRCVSYPVARDIALALPDGVAKVALTVNADDATLDKIVEAVPLDMLQLHGREDPGRVEDVKRRYGLPVMKALGIAGPEDVKKIAQYSEAADQILVDAKPAAGGPLPGGNGLTFDWTLLHGVKWPVPWMLAGGLDAFNVCTAIEMTGARQVDLSSGVEDAPGEKSLQKINGFFDALRGCAG